MERKAEQATDVLSSNLANAYESGRPDIVSVVLTSRGFSELLERVDFLKRISAHNGNILAQTRDAKTAVAKQESQLQTMRKRFSVLAKEAVVDRDQADVEGRGVPGLLLLFYLTDLVGVAAGVASLVLLLPKLRVVVRPRVSSSGNNQSCSSLLPVRP